MDKEGPDVRETQESNEIGNGKEIENVNGKLETDNVKVAVDEHIEDDKIVNVEKFKESVEVEGTNTLEDSEIVDDTENPEDAECIEDTEEGKDLDDVANQEDSQTSLEEVKKKAKKRWKKALIIASSILAVFIVIGLYLGFTDHGNKLVIRLIGDYSYGKIVKGENIETNTTIRNTRVNPKSKSKEDKSNIIPQEDKKIYNILLLGVENFEGAANTDTMIVATIDTKHKELKLTSLMRDIYVEIPDRQKNKLNAPYAIGGIDLLYEVIELNFGLALDGYVLVNYSAFEDIIDYMNGVEITLTAKEARYLNRTNYISNPANRTVKEGAQIMNGNQALGYSRIRMVSTGKEIDDFGRTSRQRVVLESLFNKVKSLNLLDLGLKMNHILSNIDIDTDISKEEYTNYLEMAFDLRSAKLLTYRVPENKDYLNEIHRIGRLDQEVLVPKSWDTTKQKLNEFINGEQ